MTVDEAISKIKLRDENGLSFIYDNYSSVLLGVINNILGDKETSEEVLQQVFMKIWNNIETYDQDKAGFYTWASTIARNSAIDKHRLVGFQNNKKTNSLDSTVYELKVDQSSTASIDIDKLLSVMDNKYKLVLDAIYLKGYSQREAAEFLDMPLGTIKTRLRMAVEILRDQLKDEKKLFIGILFSILLLLLLWKL